MLPMTDGEIYRNWLNAENPSKQVKILSELNACSQDEICNILKAQGVDFRKLPRKRKSKDENPPAKEKSDISKLKTKAESAVNGTAPVISETGAKTIAYITAIRKERDELKARLAILDAELTAIEYACGGKDI